MPAYNGETYLLDSIGSILDWKNAGGAAPQPAGAKGAPARPWTATPTTIRADHGSQSRDCSGQ